MTTSSKAGPDATSSSHKYVRASDSKTNGNFKLKMLSLLLMTVTVMVAPLVAADQERCLVNVPEVNPKRYLYYQGRTMDLRLDASGRVTHQLATHVFAIYLREVLGYAFTVVVSDLKHQNDSQAFHRLEDDTPPRVMANLEVWIAPELDLAYFADMPAVKDCGVIAPPGRIGWFIPSRLSKIAPGMDTWQFFTRPEHVGVFDVADEDLPLVREHALLSDCGDPECQGGVFVPERCKPFRHKKQPCALLLAGDYEEDKLVVELVRALGLYVKVAWLGDGLRNVTQALLRKYGTDGGRSLVVLARSPGDATLVDGDAFVSVAFPPCDFFAQDAGCSYARRRLAKLAWTHLEVAGRQAYEALQKLTFSTDDYLSLLTLYHASQPPRSYSAAACQWLRRNEAKWALWKPTDDDNYLLHIGGIFPMTGVGSSNTGRGIVRASELALEAVNRNTSILRDYTLKLLANNGQCAADIVMKTFIEYVLNGRYKTLAGILGPACSDTVEPLAGVTKHFKTVVISYSAEGASFSDRKKYPYFFRTIGENKQYKHVYLKLFDALQWKRVAALTEDGQKYSEYVSHLQDLLHLHGITLTNRKFPREREKDAMTNYLQEMKSKQARVIIVDVYDHVARDVMCEAYRLEMTARQGYVWFLPLWLNQDWYEPQSADFPCTKEHMKAAIDGHLSLSHAYFARDSEPMQEGLTVGQWRRTYEERCRNTTVEASNYAGYAYDAVWTYALALDRLARENQSYLYELHSEATTRRLVQIISATDFAGVSGRIQFLGGGPSRVTVVNVVQWLNGTARNVGYFEPNVSTEKVDIVGGRLVLNESQIVWLSPDGLKPGDGSEPPARCYMEALSRLLDVSCEAAIVIVHVTGFSFLGLLLIIAFIVVKRRYDKKVQLTQKYMKSLGIDLLSASNMGNLDKWEIPRDKVVINRKLGEGAFGTVYGGEAHFTDSGWVAVAVKTLKVGSTTEEKLDFLSEAEVMKRFEHKNVVKLLGVCTKNEPVYTIMEFMLYGDLKTFLLARRHLVNDRVSEESDEISSKKLTQMALDIARALSYLADLKYVHRDVASRNCLVNVARVVKLGDFGMTRPMFENDYYRFNRKGMLPVRWMAPESLELGIFTPSSDVWSFGVLLYEIITFGSFPFQGLSNNQVLEHVKAGNTLQIPTGVKPQLEGLICSCWNQDYKRRPQASEIVEFLANNPRLIAPCLDVPLSSVQIEDTGQLEMTLPERFRKCSMPAAQFLHADSGGGPREPLLGPKYVTLHHCDEGCDHDAMSSL